jgi:hypothetical protein
MQNKYYHLNKLVYLQFFGVCRENGVSGMHKDSTIKQNVTVTNDEVVD